MNSSQFKDYLIKKGPYFKMALNLASSAFWVATFLNYFFEKENPNCYTVSCYTLPPAIATALFLGISGAYCQTKINQHDEQPSQAMAMLSQTLLETPPQSHSLTVFERVALIGFFLNESLSIASGPTFTIKLVQENQFSRKVILGVYTSAIALGMLCSISNTLTAYDVLKKCVKNESDAKDSDLITTLKKAGPIIGETVNMASDAYWVGSFIELLVQYVYNPNKIAFQLSLPALLLGCIVSVACAIGGALGQNAINRAASNKYAFTSIHPINDETASTVSIEPKPTTTEKSLTLSKKMILIGYLLNETLEGAAGPTSTVRLATNNTLENGWLILTNLLSIAAGIGCSIANTSTVYRSFISGTKVTNNNASSTPALATCQIGSLTT